MIPNHMTFEQLTNVPSQFYYNVSIQHTAINFCIGCNNEIASQHYEEDRVYFWRKAGKALKKIQKKNTENVAGNRKMPFWSHGKLKKNLQKAGKSRFFCGKPETNPLFPALYEDSHSCFCPYSHAESSHMKNNLSHQQGGSYKYQCCLLIFRFVKCGRLTILYSR